MVEGRVALAYCSGLEETVIFSSDPICVGMVVGLQILGQIWEQALGRGPALVLAEPLELIEPQPVLVVPQVWNR